MSDREDSTQTGKSKTPEFASPIHEEFHQHFEAMLGRSITVDSSPTEIAPQVARPMPGQTRPAPVDILQLRLWPSEQRAAPSYLLRSALFAVVARGRRRYVQGETLAIWKGAHLRYEGWQLDQADLDVWMEAIHCAGPFDAEKGTIKAFFHERAFLRAIGRSGGGKDIQWLRQSIGRLQVCGVNVCIGSVEFQGPLIEKFLHDDESGRYVVYLSRELVGIFATGYTRIQAVERRRLKAPLAKWLHSYVESHRSTGKPHQTGLQALQRLCGSETKRGRDFKRQIGQVMDLLQRRRIVESWSFVGEDESTLRFQPRKYGLDFPSS